MEEVKLLGFWASPFSRRVEMGLQMKGVDYEFIEEDLQNKSPLLLQSNPIHKKIPVLLHNGKPITESLIILEYIDEAFPGPSLWPKDPYERAQARFWAKFIDEKCNPTLWKACWSTGEEQEKTKQESEQLLKILENEIKDKNFFGGDNVGAVDITANFLAHWIGIASELVGLEIITEEKYPNLCNWASRFRELGFVKQNLPPKEKLALGLKFVLQAAARSNGTSSV
ncbi:glutathione s-transferase [Striga asiatica]|uniref:Probable glutathione S-transferase n=1 Tax=Striga asiatica TaxID=4170 RepID=A0A5A7RJD4_STRAF|nr:glutathione s-transferase [Striga asiatica]